MQNTVAELMLSKFTIKTSEAFIYEKMFFLYFRAYYPAPIFLTEKSSKKQLNPLSPTEFYDYKLLRQLTIKYQVIKYRNN